MAQIKKHGERITLLSVSVSSFAKKLQPEYVLFSMKDLSKVRSFADTLRNNKNQFGCIPRRSSSNTLEIDLTDIEAKENLKFHDKIIELKINSNKSLKKIKIQIFIFLAQAFEI